VRALPIQLSAHELAKPKVGGANENKESTWRQDRSGNGVAPWGVHPIAKMPEFANILT
jgi:hypothetical protein